VALLMLALHVLDARKLAQRAIGQHDRPREIRDELPHRLTRPPRGVGCTRRR
jgi:hypothetical protein